MAEVLLPVSSAPLLGKGTRFAAEAVEADVQMEKGRRWGAHDGAEGSVGYDFGFGVNAVPLAEIGESGGDVVEVGGKSNDVPSTFDDNGADFGMYRKSK